jgi:hypothetical protein
MTKLNKSIVFLLLIVASNQKAYSAAEAAEPTCASDELCNQFAETVLRGTGFLERNPEQGGIFLVQDEKTMTKWGQNLSGIAKVTCLNNDHENCRKFKRWQQESANVGTFLVHACNKREDRRVKPHWEQRITENFESMKIF